MPNERVIEIPWMLAQLPEQGLILDVGSCEAVYLASIVQADRPLHVLDPRPCKPIPSGIMVHQQSLIGNTLPAQRYASVILLSTLEHIGLPYYDQRPFANGDALALSEVRRLLQPGGKALITVPVGHSRITSWFRQYSPDDLEHLFATWTTQITYYGYRENVYHPITAQEAAGYDYRYEAISGAGALALVIAQ